jgi:hypothetical protein
LLGPQTLSLRRLTRLAVRELWQTITVFDATNNAILGTFSIDVL